MTKTCCIYSRVSTSEQSVEMQLNDLRKYAEARGFKVFNEYSDVGVSGAKEQRAALDELMKDARKKKFDIVLVFRFDRFARSSRHLINALHEFQSLNIDFISINENIDTTSALGQAIFTIISAMSQLERDIIKSRVRAGMRNARDNGKKIGHPRADVPMSIENVLKLQNEGQSLRSIAKSLGLSHSTLSRRIKELKSNGAEGSKNAVQKAQCLQGLPTGEK